MQFKNKLVISDKYLVFLLKLRKNLLKDYVASVALYRRETWTIGKTEEKDS